MKTKTKMPKAMYGKTMMKKGGVKKMQKGGVIKKTLRKAQAGGPSDAAPSLKSTGVKNVYQGPINERDAKILDKNFPSTSKGPYAPAEYVTGNKKYSPRAVESYRRAREENMLRSNSPETQYWNKASGAGADDYGFSSSAMADAEEGTYKRGGRVKKTQMKKGGSVRKMMTGGMANSNAKVSKQTVAGSKGVMSGVNPKASASKVASSRGSGRANTPPSQATPAAKRGGAVKKMQKGGSTSAALRKAKPVPSSRSANAQKSPGTGIAGAFSKMRKGGMIKRK